jgi:hypothetical protein
MFNLFRVTLRDKNMDFNPENGYLRISICCPTNVEISDNLLEEITNFLSNYTYNIDDSWTQTDQLDIRLTIEGYENNFILEEFLDGIREKEKKVRFAIECIQPNKQYPSLIRINRQFKKIRVQNKKRLMCL